MNFYAWVAATARFRGDHYAMQLLDETELQLAALEEFAVARGRTWITLTA